MHQFEILVKEEGKEIGEEVEIETLQDCDDACNNIPENCRLIGQLSNKPILSELIILPPGHEAIVAIAFDKSSTPACFAYSEEQLGKIKYFYIPK